MPFSLIVFVLVALVVVVGPADYFLLGFLRARRLTWVFFPAAAVGATVLMVFLSEHYLGRNEGRRAMTVVDVGENGRVLRAVGCQYHFPSRNGDIETEVEDAFFSTGSASAERMWRGSAADAGTLCPVYGGRYPIRYAARQSVRKWSPFMNWQMRFDYPEADCAIRWDAVDRATLVGAMRYASGDRSDRDEWRGVTESTPSKREAMTALKEKLVGPGAFAGDILVVTRRGFAEVYRSSRPAGARATVEQKPFHVLFALSVTPQGAPRVFAFRSPCAAVDEESLALLDDSDTSYAAVIVVAPRGEDYVVYRRRYPTGM